MAKAVNNNASRYTYPYKSRFGSHRDMVNQEATAALNRQGWVVVTDEFSLVKTEKNQEGTHYPERDYITEEWKLDNGVADPNRHAQSRLKELLAHSKESKSNE